MSRDWYVDRATHPKRCLKNRKNFLPRWAYCRRRQNSGKNPLSRNPPVKKWCAMLLLGIFATASISVSSNALASTWKILSPFTTRWGTFNTFYSTKIALLFTAKAPIRVKIWNCFPLFAIHSSIVQSFLLFRFPRSCWWYSSLVRPNDQTVCNEIIFKLHLF